MYENENTFQYLSTFTYLWSGFVHFSHKFCDQSFQLFLQLSTDAFSWGAIHWNFDVNVWIGTCTNDLIVIRVNISWLSHFLKGFFGKCFRSSWYCSCSCWGCCSSSNWAFRPKKNKKEEWIKGGLISEVVLNLVLSKKVDLIKEDQKIH